MAIEIVSLPIKNGGSFHSYVNVYQRVTAWRISTRSFRQGTQDAIQRAERLAAEAASFEMAGTPRGSNYRKIHLGKSWLVPSGNLT